MKGIAASLSAMLLCGTMASAQDGTSTTPMRSFDRFEFDAATVDGMWSELAVAYGSTDTSGLQIDQVTTDVRFAYGTQLYEVGLTLPYIDLDAEYGPFDLHSDGIGDLSIYSKAVPLRSERADLGVGMVVSFPTGDEDELLGAGETGFAPFLSGNVRLDVVDLRAHYSYRAYTESGSESPPQAHLFGFGGFARLNAMFGFRTEILGEKFTGIRAEDQWVIEPGVDVTVPIGTATLVLRPTALFGLTEGATDWGLGGSVVLLLGS